MQIRRLSACNTIELALITLAGDGVNAEIATSRKLHPVQGDWPGYSAVPH